MGTDHKQRVQIDILSGRQWRAVSLSRGCVLACRRCLPYRIASGRGVSTRCSTLRNSMSKITMQGGWYEIHPAPLRCQHSHAGDDRWRSPWHYQPCRQRHDILENRRGFPGGIAGMNGAVQSVIFKAYATSIGRIPHLKAAEDGILSLLQLIILAGGGGVYMPEML